MSRYKSWTPIYRLKGSTITHYLHYWSLSLRNLLYNSLSTLNHITLITLLSLSLSFRYNPELPLVGMLLPDRPALLSSNMVSILSASSCQSTSSGCGSSFGCGHCSRSNQLAISSSSPLHISISGVFHGYPSYSLPWRMRYSLYLSCMSPPLHCHCGVSRPGFMDLLRLIGVVK